MKSPWTRSTPLFSTSRLEAITDGVFAIAMTILVLGLDVPYLWLNMGSLLLVTLVPFSTSLVSDFPGMDVSEVFFHLNILGISSLLALQWLYATRNRWLVSNDLSEETIDLDRRLNLVIPAIAIVGLAMAPVGDFESNLLYLLAPFLFPLLRRFA